MVLHVVHHHGIDIHGMGHFGEGLDGMDIHGDEKVILTEQGGGDGLCLLSVGKVGWVVVDVQREKSSNWREDSGVQLCG